MQHILWEHLRAENLPSFDMGGGVVAIWENKLMKWAQPTDQGLLRPPWSPLAEPSHWAPLVKELLAEPFAAYPDAIVCFAWTGELLQIAVGRTRLFVGSAETTPPEWFVTGKPPRPEWIKLQKTEKRLMLSGQPSAILWEIVEPKSVSGALIWPKMGIYGVLPPKKGSFGITRGMASGRVHPEEVEAPFEVKTLVVKMRKGMSAYPGPEGFRQETLIIVNEDNTWSPAPVWVGEKLDLA